MAKKRTQNKFPKTTDLVDSSTRTGMSGDDDWDQLFDPGAEGRLVRVNDPEVADGENSAPVSTRFLGFRLGREHYAVPILHLSEVVRFQEITAVPRVRRFVRGIISVRGTIVPIVDLQRRLSQQSEDDEETPSPVAPGGAADADAARRPSDVAAGAVQANLANLDRRVLITHHDGEVFGLLVDEVSDVFVAEPNDIEPPPATLPRRLLEFVSGIARVGGRIHTVLEVPAVLRFSAVARAFRPAEVVR